MRELLFVYNANSGVGHALLASIHKLLSPRTYDCSLCRLTHGLTHMHPEWKAFLQNLPVPVRFAYRNQLSRDYPELSQASLPAVFSVADTGQIQPLLTSDELNNVDLEGLMSLIQQRLLQQATAA